MMLKIPLARSLKDFFQSHLLEKAVSPNTLKSYRDTFTLLIRYIQNQRRYSAMPTLQDLDVKTILAFLRHLEDGTNGRGNSAKTRNLRLIAIQNFFKFLSLHHPSLERHAEKIMGIPIKRVPPHTVASLNRKELEALLASPRTTTSDGIRDLAILIFLYNTGARASEAADVRLSWFDFPNRTVKIFGKGRKERLTPLWPSTTRLLKLYAEEHRRKPKAGTDVFFINQRGFPFTRFGIRSVVKRHLQQAAKRCSSIAAKKLSTHSLRHTTAVHLLESRVDPNVIKAWLGHASIQSTSKYLDTDLAHKRRILEQFGPPAPLTNLDNPPSSKSDLLDWLGDL